MLKLRTILTTFLLVICLSVSAFAQKPLALQSTGTVKGVTVDFLGARVPNVTMAFDGAQVNRSVVSNAEGEFEIQLPAGQYRVTVAKVGIFYSYERKKLRVTAARVKKFDVVLRYETKKYPPIVSSPTRRTTRRSAGSVFRNLID